jgi:formylmethanofuran dehydrogenase subunit E
MTLEVLESYLAASAARHSHLCPRQVLGVRIALTGLAWFGWDEPPGKRMLVILETDGCFADGIEAVTKASVGKRTLRVEDYGKVAATFIDVSGQQAVRIAPRPGIRELAPRYAPAEVSRYRAQLLGYQVMPDGELVAVQPVRMRQSVSQIVSRPGIRVVCAGCGEEIINEREVIQDGMTLCRACAGFGYYHPEASAYPSIQLMPDYANVGT